MPSPASPLLRSLSALTLAGALLTVAPSAWAFCGFYVSGATGDLTNNATMVVLLRDGQRTIQSMQNNYQGPPQDFAMVVPVPVVLKKEEVKTLPPDVFTKVDQMAAPRLVEYWEQDPCAPPEPPVEIRFKRKSGAVPELAKDSDKKEELVKIEAQFKVGEYEVVILSAKDSGALDTWLRSNKYNIPAGAEPALRPYIASGMYFFVAKVDVKKVQFVDGRAKLSPLRFYYDSKDFNLPIRLGLLNADAKNPQDLIVHILARNQRYEVSNYPNATIPTNLDVADDVRKRFGEFYAALYDKTQQKNPGAVITEYAWDASTCDPCPGPNLNGADFLTLGADTLPDKPQWGFVLTRLHARYTKEQAKEDLMFKAASPIVGGREFLQADINELEQGSRPDGVNNFQGRYAIRHVWEGEITCQSPIRGRWGGPPGGQATPKPAAAQDTAFAPRGGVKLASFVRRDAPEIDLKAAITTRALIEGKQAPPTEQTPASVASEPAQPASAASAASEGSGSAEAPPAAEGSKGCATAPDAPSPALPTLLLLALGLVGWVRPRPGSPPPP